MNTNFNLFMSQLKETNATLDFYCDFKKLHAFSQTQVLSTGSKYLLSSFLQFHPRLVSIRKYLILR